MLPSVFHLTGRVIVKGLMSSSTVGRNLHLLFTFLLSGWCGPVSPFDSLLEFLLNLTPTFTVHRIEEELFVGADGDIMSRLLVRAGQEYFIDFPGL